MSTHHHLQRSHFLFYPDDLPRPSSQRSSDPSDSIPLPHHSPELLRPPATVSAPPLPAPVAQHTLLEEGLSVGWELRYDPRGIAYYVYHTHTTTRTRPPPGILVSSILLPTTARATTTINPCAQYHERRWHVCGRASAARMGRTADSRLEALFRRPPYAHDDLNRSAAELRLRICRLHQRARQSRRIRPSTLQLGNAHDVHVAYMLRRPQDTHYHLGRSAIAVDG